MSFQFFHKQNCNAIAKVFTMLLNLPMAVDNWKTLKKRGTGGKISSKIAIAWYRSRYFIKNSTHKRMEFLRTSYVISTTIYSASTSISSSSSSSSLVLTTELAETTAPLSSFSRTCCVIFSANSGFSSKYLIALSRPWEMFSPP